MLSLKTIMYFQKPYELNGCFNKIKTSCCVQSNPILRKHHVHAECAFCSQLQYETFMSLTIQFLLFSVQAS